MAEDLAAQRPALRAFGGVGAEQVGQAVLLALRLLQVVFERLGDRLSQRVRLVGGNRVGLEELTVGADGGGQFGQYGGQPGPGLRFPDRAVLAVDARAVRYRAGQHAHVRGGTLQRVDAVAQAGGGIVKPESPGVQPYAFLGLGERVIDPFDLAAQRPGAVQPLRRAPRVGRVGQAGRHLAEEVGHLPAQVADRVLGGLHPQRGEDQAGRQPGGRADQRFRDAAGSGRVRVDRKDQHRADRHLQDVLAEAQQQPERERGRDEQAEHPPAERNVRGARDGGQHAHGDPRHPLDGAADRVVQGRLHHQQRGQRGEHGTRGRAGQQQREQVREHRRAGQPGDVHRGRLRAAPHQRELLGLAPGDRQGGLADALAGHGTDGEAFHQLHTRASRVGHRDSSNREQNSPLLATRRPPASYSPLGNNARPPENQSASP